MSTYSDWEQRQLDEASGAELDEMGGGAAVGGILWTTCLAPKANGGKCFRGVEYKVHGVETGRTRCDEHREQERLDAYVETVKRVLTAKLAQHWGLEPGDFAEDAARNIVAALQPDLVAPPREAVGVDFDTNLISGRTR